MVKTTRTRKPQPTSKNKPRWKKNLFRLGAILLSLSPLIIFEIVARAAGWGIPNELGDPYVGFSQHRPLFVANEKTGRTEISQLRYPYFRPESFATEKPANEFRIFCVGGSTVQGRPFAIETSFTTWLEITLNMADPSRDWNVVNCGGVSYATYRLAPIVDEILDYEPDLIVIYTGHNEVLEDRTYEKIKSAPAWLTATHNRLSSLRTYSVLRNWYVSQSNDDSTHQVTELPVEIDARLDYQDGLANYQRDDDWKKNVIEHFEFNLARMMAAIKRSGTPVLLINPVANLKNTAPFKSQNSSSLTAAQLEQFNTLFEKAKLQTDTKTCRELLLQALAIDDRHAGAHFALGHSQLALGDTESARASFIRAKEEDICPLRILEPMRVSITRVAQQSKTPVLDIQSYFDAKSPEKICGDESLVDHVHPSIASHQEIAQLIFDELIRQNVVNPTTDSWQTKRDAAYRAHLANLDVLYFETGKQRLQGLIRWTQGKSRKKKTAPQKN